MLSRWPSGKAAKAGSAVAGQPLLLGGQHLLQVGPQGTNAFGGPGVTQPGEQGRGGGVLTDVPAIERPRWPMSAGTSRSGSVLWQGWSRLGPGSPDGVAVIEARRACIAATLGLTTPGNGRDGNDQGTRWWS